MKNIDKPISTFVDRHIQEPALEHVDVIMLTLDAENFLEVCLYSAYKEIPIRKLIVCDGGSKDQTIEILKNFPRVELFIRPDIKTTGKCCEFLFSKTETDWYVFLDSDLVLSPGWYDEMCKSKDKFDVIENSRRTLAYHNYKEDLEKLNINSRAGDLCHLIKKSALENYRCDDDYMWRHTDEYVRQVIEKNGFKYGKSDSTHHTHHEIPGIRYSSDPEKNFSQIIFKETELIILDQKKFERWQLNHAKAVVKYLDPKNRLLTNIEYSLLIKNLDRKWIKQTNPEWLERYDMIHSLKFRFQFYGKIKLRPVYRLLRCAKIKRKILSILNK